MNKKGFSIIIAIVIAIAIAGAGYYISNYQGTISASSGTETGNNITQVISDSSDIEAGKNVTSESSIPSNAEPEKNITQNNSTSSGADGEEADEEDVDEEIEENTSQGPPLAVSAKYTELDLQYRDVYGASLVNCFKNAEIMYVVSGSDNDISVYFYYSAAGQLIGSDSFSSTMDPNDSSQTPAFDISTYDCTIVNQSG